MMYSANRIVVNIEVRSSLIADLRPQTARPLSARSGHHLHRAVIIYGGWSVEMLMVKGFIDGCLSMLDIKFDTDIKGIKHGQFHQ